MKAIDLVDSRTQAGARRDQPVDQQHQVTSPWLTTREACAYLRFTGKHCLRSLYRFLEEQGVPTVRRGGAILVARLDLDKALVGRRRR